MASYEEAKKSRKRQKMQHGANIIKIGDKIIDLEGYLNSNATAAAPKATEIKDDTTSSNTAQDGIQSENVVEAHQPDQRKSGTEFNQHARPLARSVRSIDRSILRVRKALPLWSYQDEIRQILLRDDVLIIVGETGSGKSTQVPQFLVDEEWCRKRSVVLKTKGSSADAHVIVGGSIAITQPRRVAATTLAHRVSREVGTPLGKSPTGDVGYSVRFDHNMPRGARIKFLTEGMLLQELLRDPDLRQYSAIIVDEIHERSVDVDVLSGFLKQILLGDKAGRAGVPLKVVIMSATANVERIQEFFSYDGKSQGRSALGTDVQTASSTPRVLQVKGRQYPVELIYAAKAVPDIQESLLETIIRIHKQEPLPGDILAFLTGQEEIEAMQKLIHQTSSALSSDVPKIKALPLFGQLSLDSQQEAFQPLDAKFTRKVVLATNIAETSVTVPGVRYVIDCGKAKVKQFRPRLGMESLLAKPISKSSAIQRAGRAGREAAGKCYRLYTEETYQALAPEDLPEILRIDILGAILTMKARGVDDVLSFPLMDTPDLESIEKSLIQLHMLGALAEDGSITDAGRKMALFPLSAPLARVLITAANPQFDCVVEAIDIVACITSGEDVFQQLRSEEVKEEVEEYRKELYRREGDLLTYLTTIQQYAAENSDRTAWCHKRWLNVRNMRQALNIRKQLRQICHKEGLLDALPPPDPQPYAPLAPSRAEMLLKCFMSGFVLKTALLAPDGSYVTSQGKHIVAIHPSSVLHGQKKEAIMFLQHVFTQRNYVKRVSAIQSNWIAEVLEGDTV